MTKTTGNLTVAEAASRYITAHDLPIGVTYGRDGNGRCACRQADCAAMVYKHPVGGFDRWTRRPEQILEWIDRYPGGGIFLNLEEAGLVDLDLDVRSHSDWRAELAQLEAALGPLPPSWTFSTPSGGQHRIFAAPGAVDGLKAVTNLSPHVELRVKGAVMLPPSLHHTGGVYEWTEAP